MHCSPQTWLNVPNSTPPHPTTHLFEANSYAVGFALQSVEKSTVQYVRMSVCPENLGKWSSPPQNESELSPRSIQSYFPHLQGPSCRKSPSTFFRSKWVKYDYSRPSDGKNVFFDPIGDCNQSYKTQLDLKSADHDFLQMGPWRRGKQFWIDLGESSDSF